MPCERFALTCEHQDWSFMSDTERAIFAPNLALRLSNAFRHWSQFVLKQRLFLPDEWLGKEAIEKKRKTKEPRSEPKSSEQDSGSLVMASGDEAVMDEVEEGGPAEPDEPAELLREIENLKSLTGPAGAQRVLHREGARSFFTAAFAEIHGGFINDRILSPDTEGRPLKSYIYVCTNSGQRCMLHL